jgi:hypothetical protein
LEITIVGHGEVWLNFAGVQAASPVGTFGGPPAIHRRKPALSTKLISADPANADVQRQIAIAASSTVTVGFMIIDCAPPDILQAIRSTTRHSVTFAFVDGRVLVRVSQFKKFQVEIAGLGAVTTELSRECIVTRRCPNHPPT